jgi:prepilin-type N-terminal cleavage/methylation domain-containing protein
VIGRLSRRIRLRAQAGYSLVELIAVMAILVTVVTSITSLFVAGAKSQIELNRRFEAQQTVRIATDRMRREVHCATSVTFTSSSSVTVALPATCPTSGGSAQNIVYDTSLVSTGRYRLRRAGAVIGDYLTSGSVFTYTAQSTSSLAKLHLNLPVNIRQNEGWKTWRLQTDIVLRNSTRT